MNAGALSGYLAALFTVAVWGFTFISTRLLLASFTPLEILGARFLLGWCSLWLMRPIWLPFQGAARETTFALAGLFGVTLYFLFENMALELTAASRAAVLVSTVPFFTALLEWLWEKKRRPSGGFFAGLLMALVGVALMVMNREDLELRPLGDFLALLAALTWAFYTIFTRKIAVWGYGSLIATRRTFFYGLLFMAPLWFLRDASLNESALLEPQNMFNLLFLGVGASAVCFATWTFAIRQLGAARASVYIYFVPAITVAAASWLLGEKLPPLAWAGAILAIAGVILSERGH